MNQSNIGEFLKELRKEKGLTQEQLAEQFNVSRRSVSRWETGTNMPDISLLVEIAEFFDVSIPEIINGERKSEVMNEEVKEVADKLSDYASAEKETILKNIRSQSIMGTVALIIYCVIELSGAMSYNIVLEKIASYCETLALVTVIMIMTHTTGLIYKIQKRKKNDIITNFPKAVQMIIVAVVAFAGAVIIKLILTRIFGL